MASFVEYVVTELRNKRITKSEALAMIRRFSSHPEPVAAVRPAMLHPLVHENVSDLGRQAFRSTFVGDEPFLSDHRVRMGDTLERVLPGVAYLEMARAAVAAAVPEGSRTPVLELRDCVWLQPLVVRDAQPAMVGLTGAPGGEIGFEVWTESDGRRRVHSEGRAAYVTEAAPDALSITSLRDRMRSGALTASAAYTRFEELGLSYGPAHRALEEAWLGEGEVLARLTLPAAAASGEYVLHPSLLDGALQATLGLLSGEGARLPFAVERVRVFSACTGTMWAWLRRSSGAVAGEGVSKHDIDLADADGRVCVRLEGFVSRALPGTAAPARTGVVTAQPVWRSLDEVGEVAAWSQHHVLTVGLPSSSVEALRSRWPQARVQTLPSVEGDLGARYTAAALACFEHVQALLRSALEGAVFAQVVVGEAETSQVYAGLSGLLKTVSLENPQVRGQVVLGVTAEACVTQVASALSHAGESLVRVSGSGLEAQGWEEVSSAMPEADAPPVFKEHGVYLITGGLGGLGVVFAEEILRSTTRGRVVLSGRGEATGERAERLQVLRALGSERVSYRPVDLEDASSVASLVAWVRETNGALNGVLHSAGMVSDAFVVKKDAATFAQVLGPKVRGTMHLLSALESADVDFVALFSSVAGAFGNVGQADYAAANGFLDGIAGGRVVSVNWPLWATGGMALSPELAAELRRTTGMVAMTTAEGLQALRRALSIGPRSVVLAGEVGKLRSVLSTGVLGAMAPLPSAPAEAAVVEAEAANATTPTLDEETLRGRLQDWLRRRFGSVLKLSSQRIDVRASLEQYGIDSILAMRLTGELEKSFGALSKTLLFEHRNIESLAEHLWSRHEATVRTLLTPKAVPAVVSKPVAAKPAVTSAATSGSRLPVAATKPRAASPAEPKRSRLEAAEPIAVVGLSGRYPEAWDVAAFWENLKAGRDCIVEVPVDRWDWRDYYSADRTQGGHHYSRWGGFIGGVDEFDPLFFSMSPLEAERIDPQERLFLQHAWMAVEDAGYTRSSLHGVSDSRGQRGYAVGEQVGVYVGVMYSEYQLFGAEASLRGRRMGLAGSFASIANRVSYALDLHGPSMTVDTMCSSSLTAIHLACQDLRAGRTRMAIAGGVNVTIHPNKYLVLSSGQFISSDGHCQSFGEGGDGYIPGEGVGAVVLKRLSDAERDGDRIYGLIRGSALSHGGRTNGYTVPNPQAQTSAIVQALADAGVEARRISYVEAHGTGTKLGDPIEIAALGEAFGRSRADSGVCLIGSAKSNIGHCEAAAGIAGLTKVLLQLQHGEVVPSLHSSKLNPHIDFGQTAFEVNQTLRPWPVEEEAGRRLTRIAGLSSFGAGGSNAHLVVEEYLAPVPVPTAAGAVLVVLSARTEAQLRQKARDLAAFVRERPDTDLASLAYTLQVGREAMEERLALVVDDASTLVERLSAFAEGAEDVEDLHVGQAKRYREVMMLFATDTALQEAVGRWLSEGRLEQVAGLWSKGLEVRWSQLYPDQSPRRMSLPAYPFARERHWVQIEHDMRLTTGMRPHLHPMLHENISDLARQAFRSTFVGDEPFLSDHRVRMGDTLERVLPGVAYLEMARAAVAAAVPEGSRTPVLELRDCVWLQPLVVRDAQPAMVGLTGAPGGELGFEVWTESDGRRRVHSEGRAAYVTEAAPDALSVTSLRERMRSGVLTASAAYARFEELGLSYGPAHRALEEAWLGEGEVLARLTLPAVAASGDYVLHPSLLDGALQATLGLLSGEDARLPFAVERVRVFGACTGTMWAWLRRSSGAVAGEGVSKHDIDLADADGRVCVRLEGFVSRALPGTAAPARTGVVTAQPVWRSLDEVGEVAAWSQHHVLAIGLPSSSVEALRSRWPQARVQTLPQIAGDVAEAYTEATLTCFEHVQALLRGAPEGAVLVQVVVGEIASAPVYAGLSGLLKTVSLENPQVRGQVVLGVTAEACVAQVASALAHAGEAVVRVSAAGLEAQGWEEVPAETLEADAPPVFKEHGVYLITGGLGGLGVVFAEEILRSTTRGRVVLSGRGEATGERAERLQALRALGGERVSYRPVDLEDASSVSSLVAWVRETQGGLAGVLHSAGMVSDAFVVKKDAATFAQVLGPKVRGTQHLLSALESVDIDFVALFSSVAGAFGNVGQADYAAANGFLDGIAGGRVVSVNWPLWATGGMALSPELAAELRRTTGMVAMTTAEGLQALRRALSIGPRSVVLAGEVGKLRSVLSTGVLGAMAPLPSAPAEAAVVEAEAANATTPTLDEETLRGRLQDWLRRRFGAVLKLSSQRIDVRASLEQYGIDSILAMRLTGELEKSFGALSKTLLFEHQTIASLANYLMRTFPEAAAREVAGEEGERTPRQTQASTLPQKAIPVAAPIPSRFMEAVPAKPQRKEDRAVAIIGIAGRYPMSEDLDAFWENLKAGRDCITEIPSERWDHARYFDPDRNAPGKAYSKWGGFLSDIDKFDPLLFNISPKEAELLDPQERLFLETAWQTIEDAGYDRQRLAGTRTGVYVGVMWGQYELYGVDSVAAGHIGVPSSSQASIANRVSFFFDLHGPSFAIDTMCSSSLTAIHLACEEIRRGNIDTAIAGGVNLSVHPHKYLTLSQGKFASTDGRCRSFGAGGDGYVPGEGVGAVLLKSLDDAIRDGDRIHAVVRASAVNHGGKTNGYTVPNPNAQAEVILASLRQAGVEPDSIGYIEAHGTGTSLGDPIEISGLANAFRDYGTRTTPCAIGSVKSNIGHLESAAGIAAVTKSLLQLRHGMLVPSLHAETKNPNIDFAASPFRVQAELAPWQAWAGQPRRCGISSFGAGGSNAHLVLEEYVAAERPAASPAQDAIEPFLLSARDVGALKRLVQRMLDHVEAHPELRATDVAYTLQVGRTAMNARLAILAQGTRSFAEALRGWLASQDNGQHAIAAKPSDEDRIVFGLANDRTNQIGLLVDGESGAAYLRALIQAGDRERLARLWTMGVDIDWRALRGTDAPARVSLPTYPFERQRYWLPVPSAGTPPNPPARRIEAIESASRREDAPQQLTYGFRWEPTPLDDAPAARTVSPLLVLDTSGSDATMAMLAEVDTADRIVVRAADAFRQRDADRFDVRFGVEEDFRAVFAELMRQQRLPRVVLHLHGHGETDASSSLAAAEALLHLAKAGIASGHAMRIVSVATCDPGTISPGHAALSGFLKSLCQEQPGFTALHLAIEASPADAAAIVSREIARASFGRIEEIRHAPPDATGRRERLMRRLARRAPPSDLVAQSRLRHGGVYLIAGGLGGLGLLFAEYLAKEYAAKLVLVGRSAPSADTERRLAIARVNAGGIVTLRGDVSNPEDAARVAAETRRAFGRIDGVIHAAGLTRDAYVLKKSVDELRAVAAAKVAGTVQLDRVTADDPLDLFVAFSSLAGAVGNAGQSDYAFANAYLDAFVERRERQRAAGLRRGRACSIGWPLWEEGGMQLTADQVAALAARTGLAPMPSAEGLRRFEHALRSDSMHDIVLFGVPGKIDAYLDALQGRRERDAKTVSPVPATGSDLRERTLRYLRDLIGAEIKLDPEAIDIHERIESYGLDSVAITSLNTKLESDLGDLPKTLLYENETVGEVAAYLLRSAADRLVSLLGERAATGPDAALDAMPADAVHDTPKPVVPHVTAAALPEGALSRPAAASTHPVVAETHDAPRERADVQRIAIVGMHGSHAGLATAEAFWDCLREGQDAVGVVPPDRWNATAYFDPDPSAAAGGKIYCRHGGFMEGVDRFDPGFFNIPRDEAMVMDPQERLFLMSVWRALEDAGYSRDRLRSACPKGRGVDAGVFVGVTTQSYQMLIEEAKDSGRMATPSAMPWSIANRVSYFFDFKGPSLPVDTACSSALVALHMACESLRRGECAIAVAGGVNLYLHHSKYLSLCQRHMLATGDKTRSYGAGDEGFVPGEGIGCFILKPYERAVADGDRIHGVIVGSACDHSGRSNGYSAPNPGAQADIVDRALSNAQVDPDSIGCVEGHGTGTMLGDSLEVAALTQAFRRHTGGTQYCALGSVKSNVGHSESASGVASLMKVLLQLQHRELVPTLHCEPANADIDFEHSPFYLQRTRAPWVRQGASPRRALVNGFGAGGVNACLVVEEHVDDTAADRQRPASGPHAFVLSANDPDALRRQVANHLHFLERRPDLDLPRYCRTLQLGRDGMKERLGAVVDDRDALVVLLRRWLGGDAIEGVFSQASGVVTRRARSGNPDRFAGMQKAEIAAAQVLEWISGVEPDWMLQYPDGAPVPMSAPTYPFATERCWIIDGDATARRSLRAAEAERLPPLLSYNSSNFQRVSFDSWIAADGGTAFDASLHGERILPPSAMLEIACACGTLAGDARVSGLRDVTWKEPLRLNSDLLLVRTIMAPQEADSGFRLVSMGEGGDATQLASGRLRFGKPRDAAADSPGTLASLRAGCESIAPDRFYDRLAARGLGHGPTFRALREIFVGPSHALSRIELPETAADAADLFLLHPALVEAAFATALAFEPEHGPEAVWMPSDLAALSIHRRPSRVCHAHATISGGTGGQAGSRAFDILLLNDESEVLVEIRGLWMKVSSTMPSQGLVSANE